MVVFVCFGQCAVYLGAVHFTKSTHFVCFGVYLLPDCYRWCFFHVFAGVHLFSHFGGCYIYIYIYILYCYIYTHIFGIQAGPRTAIRKSATRHRNHWGLSENRAFQCIVIMVSGHAASSFRHTRISYSYTYIYIYVINIYIYICPHYIPI